MPSTQSPTYPLILPKLHLYQDPVSNFFPVLLYLHVQRCVLVVFCTQANLLSSEQWCAWDTFECQLLCPRKLSFSTLPSPTVGGFSIDDGHGSKNVTFKWICILQTLSRLFQFAENVKCRRISLDLISWGPHSTFERKRKIPCCLFTSSIKHEIGDSQAIAMQWQQRNVQKSVLHMQKVVLLPIKPIAFWHSRCHRHHRCYKSPCWQIQGDSLGAHPLEFLQQSLLIDPGLITIGKITGFLRHRDLCLKIWDLRVKNSRFEDDDKHTKWHSETQEKHSKPGLTKWGIINRDGLDWYLLDSSPLDLQLLLLLNVLEYDL